MNRNLKTPELNHANIQLVTAGAWSTALIAFGIGSYFGLLEQYPSLIVITVVASILGTVHRLRSVNNEEPLVNTINDTALLGLLGSTCLLTLTQVLKTPYLL